MKKYLIIALALVALGTFCVVKLLAADPQAAPAGHYEYATIRWGVLRIHTSSVLAVRSSSLAASFAKCTSRTA